jgi:hypothetical protein
MDGDNITAAASTAIHMRFVYMAKLLFILQAPFSINQGHPCAAKACILAPVQVLENRSPVA